MKTERELREKIDLLDEKRKSVDDDVLEENIMCQIDALLWVLGDRSGSPLLDERE